MLKRNLLNLILFIIIIVLVIFVIYEPKSNDLPPPPTLTNLKSSDIKHLTINRPFAAIPERQIEFEKTQDGWMMLKPHSMPANIFRIESILKILSTVSFSQNDLTQLNEEKFGLNKSKVTLTFNKNTALVFGHNKSLKNHRYINIANTLHLISDTFFYQLGEKSDSYVSHQLISEQRNIKSIHLPNITLRLVDGRWLSNATHKKYTADSINLLIKEWKLSQAYDLNIVKIKKDAKADIKILLDDGSKLNFIVEKTNKIFNLINIKSGIRYIFSPERKNKLLTIPTTNENI